MLQFIWRFILLETICPLPTTKESQERNAIHLIGENSKKEVASSGAQATKSLTKINSEEYLLELVIRLMAFLVGTNSMCCWEEKAGLWELWGREAETERRLHFQGVWSKEERKKGFETTKGFGISNGRFLFWIGQTWICLKALTKYLVLANTVCG